MINILANSSLFEHLQSKKLQFLLELLIKCKYLDANKSRPQLDDDVIPDLYREQHKT